MEPLINFILLAFMAVTAIAIVRMTNLFAVAMLSGIYSFLSAGLFVVLDAVDVAFTEASVGAGITTVLFLGTLALTRREEMHPKRWVWIPLGAVAVTGLALVYGTLDAPHFGDPQAPAHNHVAPEYLRDTVPQYGEPTAIGIPNIVTNVLASYRAYDTLGEVVVIFTAGIGVLLLLGHAVRRRQPAPKPDTRSAENGGARDEA